MVTGDSRRKYELPEINSGDVVKVTFMESMTDKTETSFQGIVLGKFNKGVMSAIELRNVVDGVPIELRIPLLSPLVTAVEVVAPRLKKQRHKLYHLRDRPLVDSQFDDLSLKKTGGFGGKKTRKKLNK